MNSREDESHCIWAEKANSRREVISRKDRSTAETRNKHDVEDLERKEKQRAIAVNMHISNAMIACCHNI